jgi:hypothetical protein
MLYWMAGRQYLNSDGDFMGFLWICLKSITEISFTFFDLRRHTAVTPFFAGNIWINNYSRDSKNHITTEQPLRIFLDIHIHTHVADDRSMTGRRRPLPSSQVWQQAAKPAHPARDSRGFWGRNGPHFLWRSQKIISKRFQIRHSLLKKIQQRVPERHI